MKISILIAFVLCNCAALVTEAQKSDAEAEAVANLLGVQKKEAISKLVSVSGKDSVAFWKVYDEYRQENQKLMKDRINLYEGTANAYSNLTPAIADSLANKYFAVRGDQEKMLETYYKKVKAATNATVAFQFYQAETYLITQIRAQIMNQIPTYGELMKAFPKK